MRRLFAAAALILLGTAAVAYADDRDAPMHHSVGLGFHSTDAPVGLRWWFAGQKVALDLGFGFNSVNEVLSPFGGEGYSDERLINWTFEAGVPFVIHSWPRVHVLLRPGFSYDSQEFTTSAGPPDAFTTETSTTLSLTGELEAEVFLADNLSVSASHGIAFVSFDPGFPGSDSQSAFGTIGNNFTEVGFHVYFLGGGN